MTNAFLSLKKLITSNTLHFTQNSINTILGARLIYSEMYRIDSIARMVQKERDIKESQGQTAYFFQGDDLFIIQLWRIFGPLFKEE